MGPRTRSIPNRKLSTAGFIVGGVALIATDYFFLWPDAKTNDSPTGQNTPKLRVTGAAMPHSANVWLADEF